MILDTNAVSAIVDGDPAIGALRLQTPGLTLPVVVMGEYLYGLLGSRHESELRPLFERLIEACETLASDRATAPFYASVRRSLTRRGRPIPENDLWIAALARQHDLPIVSRDRHFDEVEGVTRVGW